MNGPCIVPECLNNEGIPLYKDPHCSEKLLQVLQMDKTACTAENFVCFEHLNCKHLHEGLSPDVSVEETIANSDVDDDESIDLKKEIHFAEKGNITEQLCRVCLSKEHLNTDISNFIEENINIATAIMYCAHPVKIDEDLPQSICDTCFETLTIAYKFYKKCIVTDQILQIRHQKRKRRSLKAELNSGQVKKVKSSSDETKFSSCTDQYSMEEVEKNMEALHGYGGTLENDNEESAKAIFKIILEDPVSVKRNDVKPTISKKATEILPNKHHIEGLQIKRVTPYKSAIGKFKGVVKIGVHDSIFVQVDGYLFEYGLLKGSARHIRCTVPNCSASGKQTLQPNGRYDDIIEILNPHNHEAPDENTIRKHMFLCWMRKKMQSDKTLSIRNIYEDATLEDPDIKTIIPLRNVINEICRHHLTQKMSTITSFEMFYKLIETDAFDKLHFTHNNQQFYQEKFYVEDDDSMAVLFANASVIEQLADSQIMYVDASFKIDTSEDFKYQLVTVLVWIEDSYFPILFALINKKSQLLFRRIFSYLHDDLAPELRPLEIVTDYEANIYYALAEIYNESRIGGSVFYYTQNLYKKLCSLNLSRDLETNSYFRNVYHMLLMLPLLPVNTILDGLNTIEIEAKTLSISELARPLFDHVRTQWILNVTPELFCVHKLESRINENVIAPFKKLRDFLLLTKGKGHKVQITITYLVEKIIELEQFLRSTYSRADKKSFGRDLSSSQKKHVVRAWQYIEEHPKIEMGNFFAKVLGYIKCMENQLWIWGFYRYDGDTDDILIDASHFSIEVQDDENQEEDELQYIQIPRGNTIVMEAVVDRNGILQPRNAIQ